jgi:nucleoside-diphosphate-sugar epimerase
MGRVRALVTGHLGFVGQHLVRRLEQRRVEVIGIDLKDGADVNDCDLPVAGSAICTAKAATASSTSSDWPKG